MCGFWKKMDLPSGHLLIVIEHMGLWGDPQWLSGSEFPCSAGDEGDSGSIPGSGRSLGEGHGNPLQYSCLENPRRQRSLAGYSPWGLKGLDTTKYSTGQLCLNLYLIS